MQKKGEFLKVSLFGGIICLCFFYISMINNTEAVLVSRLLLR